MQLQRSTRRRRQHEPAPFAFRPACATMTDAISFPPGNHLFDGGRGPNVPGLPAGLQFQVKGRPASIGRIWKLRDTAICSSSFLSFLVCHHGVLV